MCLTECLTETIFANVWAKTLPRKARSPLSVTFVAQKRLCLSSLFRNEGGGGGGGVYGTSYFTETMWYKR